MFIKYKHKKGKERMIWCASPPDRIFWGSPNKKTVKGYILVREIQRISNGGSGHA